MKPRKISKKKAKKRQKKANRLATKAIKVFNLPGTLAELQQRAGRFCSSRKGLVAWMRHSCTNYDATRKEIDSILPAELSYIERSQIISEFRGRVDEVVSKHLIKLEEEQQVVVGKK